MNKRIVDGNCLVIEDRKGVSILKIEEIMDGKSAVVNLSGDVTTGISHEFEDELVSIASVCDAVQINMSDLKSISSAGMHTLLSVQQILDKRPKTNLTLKGVSKEVLENFADIGFLELFNIEN